MEAELRDILLWNTVGLWCAWAAFVCAIAQGVCSVLILIEAIRADRAAAGEKP